MNARLRVLFLSGPLEVTGATVFTLDLARGLRHRGHEVSVLAGDGPFAPRFSRGVHHLAIREITGAFARDLTRIGTVRRAVRERAPDLIHVADGRLGRQGAILSRLTGLPWVLSVHRPPTGRGRTPRPRPGAVLVPGRAVREEVARRRPAWRDRILVLPPGVNLSRYPTGDGPRPGALPVTGTFTPFDPEAGAADLLEAARRLLDEGARFHLLLTGPADADRALHGKVRRLGLGHHVTITPLPPAFEAVLGTIDVYVQPDRTEGPALPILNALAAARPVVATGVGSTFGVIREGETGLLVPRRDPGAMARAIGKLLEDPARAAKMGAAGRKLVSERFPASGSAEAAERIYRAVLEGEI